LDADKAAQAGARDSHCQQQLQHENKALARIFSANTRGQYWHALEKYVSIRDMGWVEASDVGDEGGMMLCGMSAVGAGLASLAVVVEARRCLSQASLAPGSSSHRAGRSIAGGGTGGRGAMRRTTSIAAGGRISVVGGEVLVAVQFHTSLRRGTVRTHVSKLEDGCIAEK
jgi:hypothetical protein